MKGFNIMEWFDTEDESVSIRLCDISAVELDVSTVETNIVIFRVTSIPAEKLAQKLHQAGVYVLATGVDTIRAVTNLNVSSAQISETVKTIRKVLS